MMYQETAISELLKQIGWAAPQPPTTISLTLGNEVSDSGRSADSFHTLVIVENVASTVRNMNLSNDDLNKYLKKMRTDSVREVLSKVFEQNIRANHPYTNDFVSTGYATEYTAIIIGKVNLFVDAYGLALAIRALQLFLTTNRSNPEERIMGMSYNQLKGEVEGFFNADGHTIALGLKQKYELAIANIIDILFPITKKDTPTLIGRRPW